MTFEELIASLQNPGEEGASPTIYDDLTASYNDLATGAEAKLALVTAELAAANEKLTAVMAHNYELLTTVQGNTPDPSGDATPSDEEEFATLDDIISYS